MATTPSPPLLRAGSVSKRFLATRALDDVSFDLRSGEVHALIGENGAGKSTLIRILGGVHRPDSGRIEIAGRPAGYATPAEALDAGIVLIPQEMQVVPDRTVAENVLLGQVPVRRRLGLLRDIDRPRMNARAAELLALLDLDVDVERPVRLLGYAERQLVMIARALGRDARILVLDEPTASLEAREVGKLFDVIGTLKRRQAGVVYVSHRLDEVERIADRVTVLRDGRKVGGGARGDLTRDGMIALMTGRDLRENVAGRRGRAPADPLLEAGDIALGAGEIVGMAGLLGSGTGAMLHRLYGAGAERCRARIDGRPATVRRPRDAIGHGIGLVPGERALGLIMGLSVRDNVVLPNLDVLSTALRLDRARIDGLVATLIDKVDIRPRDPDRPVRELSGGNQQKVVFARWLAGHARILLLDEPTHGIDIGAKVHIHELMDRFAADGGGIVFSSSETGEVMSMSDSVLAVRDGRIVARLTRDGDYTEGALRGALGG